MKKLDIRLLRLIKNVKGQFISITVMVILALITYVSFSMVSDNLSDSIFKYYEVTNFSDIFIEVVRIPQKAIDQLHNIEGIEIAQGRISIDVPLRVNNPNEKVRVRVVSYPKVTKVINDLYVLDGRELQDNSKAAVVLQQFSDARGINLGDKVVPYIAGREYHLEVVGIVGSPEYIYLMENEQALLPAPEKFGIIYVTEDFAQSVFGYQGSYNEVMIKIKDEYANRIDNIIDEIEDQLDRYGVKQTVKRDDQLSHNMMMQEIDQLDKTSTVITLLFLGVAAVITGVMLSRIVKSDRMAIGIMKALGYSNLSILEHYSKFSLSIGLAGSVIGILLSIPISRALTDLYIIFMNIPMFQMRVYYVYFLYGIFIASAFCVISGLVGARSVLKILPADSMRPELPKAGGRIWIENIKTVWNRVPFSWKMVIRNILRNKRRAVFLILGIALTYGMTLVPIFMSSVWNNIFMLQYGEFQTMDYNIDFAIPMNNNALRELSQIIQAERIEPKAEVHFELRNGWKKKAVSIIGIPIDTNFYHFKSPAGKPINLPETGIVLADRLANNLGVRLGDKIAVKSFIPDKGDNLVEVKGITIQYLGTNAYMSIEAMNGLLGEKNIITGALISSNDEIVSKLQNVKNIQQIQSIENMKNSFLEFLNMIIYSVGVLLLFGGILGFALIYNVTIISISERVMEFSSLRVMGYYKKELFKIIARENAVVTVLGVILGMPLGCGMCIGIVAGLDVDIVSIPVIITPINYTLTAIATVSFIIIAQLATVRKINQLNFIDALKNRIS